MNKRSFALIMATSALVLCLLSPFAGAVTISYTADSGGESVSLNENYDIDNTVTVKESTDISFGNLQVDQERTAEGTGEADLEQTITGKTADGTQYTAENVILSNGTINAKTYTSATGNTLGVNQAVAVTGDAELILVGEESGNMAGQYASVENGSVSSRQALVIGNSVHTSQDTSIRGENPMAFGGAGDLKADLITGTIDGGGAVIGAGVLGIGEMDACFSADTSHSASASGSITAEGDLVVAGAGAGNIAVDLATGTVDGEGAVIGAGAFGDGKMDACFSADTSHSASASGSITAEGDLVVAGAGAGNIAVDLATGTVEGEGAVIGAGAFGDGEMDACFSADTSHSASASGSITAEGDLVVAGAGAGNIAVDLATGTAEGEGAVIGAGAFGAFGDGEMDACFSADTSHSASASGSITAEGDLVVAGAGAGNIAVDLATGTVEGEGAVIGAGAFGDGEMDACLSADTSHSASASGSISAEGLGISAIVGAVNQYGAASIENTVDFGTLDFESLAIANEDEAFCSQDMVAIGPNIDVNADAHNVDPTIPDASATMSDSGTLSTHATATVTEADAEATIVEWLGCP